MAYNYDIETIYKELFLVKTWIIAILFTFLFTPIVQAHPHVFITPKATVVMNNHSVSQINVEWDFDAMSSALFLESCGSNPDEIWNTVFPQTQVLTDGSQSARSGYYTNVEIDGVPIDNLTPANFNVSYVDGSLHCQFTLNINQNINNTLKIWFNDPSMNDAFDVQQGNFQVSDQSETSHVIQRQTENDIDKIIIS